MATSRSRGIFPTLWRQLAWCEGLPPSEISYRVPSSTASWFYPHSCFLLSPVFFHRPLFYSLLFLPFLAFHAFRFPFINPLPFLYFSSFFSPLFPSPYFSPAMLHTRISGPRPAAPGWKMIYTSVLLGTKLRLRVTTGVQRSIRDAGGFDRYIYYTPDEELGFIEYSGTSDKGSSEIGTTSLQRTKLSAPKCPLFRGFTVLIAILYEGCIDKGT